MIKIRPSHSLPSRRGMARSTLVVGGLLWAAVIGSALLLLRDRSDDSQATAAESENDLSNAKDGSEPDRLVVTPDGKQSSVKLGFPAKRLPDFEFEDCTGGTLSLDDLKGKRWVASFIFTSCTMTCPAISKAMMEVHDRVEEKAPDVMFVSFTVYPRVDNAERLRTYSETFTKGNWDRWKFLTGSQQQIYELIVKGFGQFVKEHPEAGKNPGLEVAHSNRVVLVNEDGIPVGTFLGTRAEDMVKLRRILLGQDDFPEPGTGSGLTFSTTDGSPLNIQFEVTPAKVDDGSESEAVDENAAEDSATDSLIQPLSSAIDHNRAIDEKLPTWAKRLPTVNAGLNTLSAMLLFAGFVSIKSGRKETHRNLMVTAFVTSAVFLVCYLTYHYALGKYTGEHGKKFPGEGVAAVVYQLILWPHIVLAVFVPILAIRVFQHAFAARWDAHRKLAKVTFPIWMFVSITGVVIYGMLYHWPWPADTAAVTSPAEIVLSLGM